jgi:hypothetical protein
MDEIQFEVGGKYENMKGVFEVIAIRRDSMDIRWESGEEISTPIELQQRIIERMQHEKEMEAAKALQKAKKSKASSKAGKQFTGLEESDFSNTVSKTSWRGRGQLGGAVAQRFKTKQFKFNSWAVLRKPEVNWLDVKRQKQEDLPLQGKFFARVESDHFFYGLTVPAPAPSETQASDWHRLMDWLVKPENDAWLKKQCLAHDLHLCDLGKQGFSGTIASKEDQWVAEQAGKSEPSLEPLSTFLSTCVKSDGVDLRIQKQIDKATAIDKKQGIAGDMATLFETLMPIYAAIAGTAG